jgi:hypothetical protein
MVLLRILFQVRNQYNNEIVHYGRTTSQRFHKVNEIMIFWVKQWESNEDAGTVFSPSAKYFLKLKWYSEAASAVLVAA